jgi:hypothetical protein
MLEVVLIFLFFQKIIKASWSQVGSSILGIDAGALAGSAVAINFPGDTIAIGASQYSNKKGQVKVYFYNDDIPAWTQMGRSLEGTSDADGNGAAFGYSVALNSNGEILAVGAIYAFSSGAVYVYKFIDDWTSLGNPIYSSGPLDLCGFSVSLTFAGTRLAIGSIQNDGNGNNAGNVRVYNYVNDDWVQFGYTIDGDNLGDLSGFSVSISADGTRLARGAIFSNTGSVSNTGSASVFQIIGNTWTQLGNVIRGERARDLSGYSVSLSATGHRVVVGAIHNNDAAVKAGSVRVYEYQAGYRSWWKIGQDIDGVRAGLLRVH